MAGSFWDMQGFGSGIIIEIIGGLIEVFIIVGALEHIRKKREEKKWIEMKDYSEEFFRSIRHRVLSTIAHIANRTPKLDPLSFLDIGQYDIAAEKLDVISVRFQVAMRGLMSNFDALGDIMDDETKSIYLRMIKICNEVDTDIYRLADICRRGNSDASDAINRLRNKIEEQYQKIKEIEIKRYP